MLKKLFILLGFLYLTGYACHGLATSGDSVRYVHDVLRIELRSGPSSQHRILKLIDSGTRLHLTPTPDGREPPKNWSHVKTDKEIMGWVRTQYLTATPIARTRLQNAESRLKSISEKSAQQLEVISKLQAELDTLKAEYQTLQKSHNHVNEELGDIKKASGSAIQTAKANRELREKNQLLGIEVEQLKIDNAALSGDRFSSGIKWGTLALLIGAFLAIVLPRLTPPKRRSGWV